MSGQITAELADSTALLDTHRVSVVATINSDLTGIKTILNRYFLGAKLGAKIQRAGVGITKVTLQGNPEHINSTLNILAGVLRAEYGAAIVWGEMSKVTAENRFNSVTIEDTKATLNQDPSFGEEDFEEISFGGSAMTENLNKMAIQVVESVMGRGIGCAKGWIPATRKKHISVKLGDKEYDLEISSISSMKNLLWVIGKKFETTAPIKSLYLLEDGDIVLVNDVKDLREDFVYNSLTVNEELPKKQTVKFSRNMEEFFERLRTEQELDDDDMEIIKGSFGKQKIKFKNLMATGDLALTDWDLEKYGILQGGLRKAILSVIKTNR